eukprot:TRINITY_DN26463_c0_g1_i2.p2 TRINITY_DN26463_c0_g1~~TRINITY_DN26463_c0_g1_i2.p2  ORF type:complete len:142 (+),score=15.64 TRINITY_DN26463_c0_g1_i2:503-928(+)
MSRNLAEEQLARKEADAKTLGVAKEIEEFCIKLSEKVLDTSEYKNSLRSRMDKALNRLANKVDSVINRVTERSSTSQENSFKFLKRANASTSSYTQQRKTSSKQRMSTSSSEKQHHTSSYKKIGRISVSYTHLTLPTICSV